MNKGEILCAVDFSESSIDALKWSVELAGRTRSKLAIMFCYRLIAAFGGEETLDLKKNMERDAWAKFHEFEKRHLTGQPFQYSFIAEIGFYHLRIEMFLRSHPVEVVVLSNTIVQHFDENKNLGFAAFLKTCKVPVVVVPHETEQEKVLM